MHRPLPPIFFVGVFLLVVIASVLMLAQVISRQRAEPKTTPRAALALQLALVQAGDAVGLRLTCTEDLRPAITHVAVSKAKTAYAGKTLEEIVGSIEDTTKEGEPERRLVLDPEGGVLTRLLLVAGDWQAQTLWFFQG
jgi:hypothetical protein